MWRSTRLSRTSHLFILYYSLVNLSFYIFNAYYIIFLQSNDLSYLDMSLVYGVSFLSASLCCFPAGNFADRFGRKFSFTLGSALITFAMIVYALTTSLPFFMFAEVFFGIGVGLAIGPPEAWLVDQLARERRQEESARAMTTAMGLSYLLGIIGGAIGSLLVVYALNLPFFFGALLTFFTIPLSILFFEENYGSSQVKYRDVLGESVRYFSSTKVVQTLASAEVLRYSAVSIYFFIYQPYMVSVGLGKEWLGVYFSVLMVSSVIGSLLAPPLSARLDRGTTLIISASLISVSFTLQLLLPNLWAAALLFPLVGLANGISWPTTMIWRNHLIPSHIRAAVLSIMSTLNYICGAIITLLLGLIIDASSISAAFVIAALLGAFAVPFYLMTKRNEKRMSLLPSSPAAYQQM